MTPDPPFLDHKKSQETNNEKIDQNKNLSGEKSIKIKNGEKRIMLHFLIN